MKEPMKDWWKFALFDILAIILFFLRRDDPYMSQTAVFVSLVYSLLSCYDSNKEKHDLRTDRDSLDNECKALRHRVYELEDRLSHYERL